jgi:hypothetical protein
LQGMDKININKSINELCKKILKIWG